MAKRKEYSSKFNYALMRNAPAGVMRGTSDPADWNTISAYKSPLENAVETGGLIAANMVSPSVVTTATFDIKGISKTEPPGTLGIDPRVLLVNSGRRWTFGNTTPNALGANTSSSYGHTMAAISSGTSSDGSDSDGAVRQIATGASAGDTASFQPNSSPTGTGQLRHYPYRNLKQKFNHVSGFRWWFGLGSADPSATDTPGSGGISGAWVRLSSGAGDTTFKLVTADGASQTVTDTLLTAATATLYQFQLWFDGTNVILSINDGNVVQSAATLPVTTTDLASTVDIARSTTAGTQYQFKPYSMFLSQF